MKLLRQLKRLHQREKGKASQPSEKVVEEAIEVVMAYLGQGDLEGEKVDLLMSLVAGLDVWQLEKWRQRMERRGRTPTSKQQKFLNLFGV